MNLFLNPELRKNFWLKFSFFRLISVPVLVSIVLYIITNQADNWAEAAYQAAYYGFVIIVFIWGNFEAANSIASEAKNNTWDFQKMSSIGPWELTIGKLFGATSFTWYFGLILLGIMAVCAPLLPPDATGKYGTPIAATILYLVIAGIMGQATSILTALENIKFRKSGVFGPFLLGFIVSHLASAVNNFDKFNTPETHSWYWIDANIQVFSIATLMFAFFWILVGLQRKMREQLQFRNSPVAWTAFLVSIAAYFGGFDFNASPGTRFLFIYLILCALLYIALLGEARNLIKYQRFIRFYRLKQYHRLWENTPLWAPSLCLALIFLVLSNIFVEMRENPLPHQINLLGGTITLLLFIIRDALFVHCILLDSRKNRDGFLLLFYYIMVYFLLPFLCISITETQNEAMGTEILKRSYHSIAVFFYPVGSDNLLVAVVPPLLQCLFMAFVLKSSLKKMASRKRNGAVEED